jgi:hypothetical protein
VILGETEREENFEIFSQMIIRAHTYKRNLVIIRNTDAVEHLSEVGDRSVHVWWGGRKQNAGLMLTLGYMLQTSPEWRGFKLHLKSVVKKEEEKREIEAFFDRILNDGRVQADREVTLLGEGKNPFDIISEQSKDGSLVFIGLRPPEQNESPEEYCEYNPTHFKKTAGLPRLAIVLAAEEMKFEDIFL